MEKKNTIYYNETWLGHSLFYKIFVYNLKFTKCMWKTIGYETLREKLSCFVLSYTIFWPTI